VREIRIYVWSTRFSQEASIQNNTVRWAFIAKYQQTLNSYCIFIFVLIPLSLPSLNASLDIPQEALT
jgi:hypothetical protein